VNGELQLLIEWPSRWQEFVTAIRPALAKSARPLAGEARSGLFPRNGMLAAWIAEAILLAAAIVLPARLAFLAPYQPPSIPKYDVIYFSGEELPQTEDLGGAKTGKAGAAGGQEAFHRTQVIRVSRGDLLRERVVDAPALNLPQSSSAVANLLAYRSLPGPPPAEGLRSSLQAPDFNDNVVAPAPDVRRENMLVAPNLDGIIAPSPDVRRDKLRTSPAMSTSVVPPPPSGLQRDGTFRQIPGSQAIAVVPPPVSAPERTTNTPARLTLPAPGVVAPPPTQVARDSAIRGPGFGPGEIQKQVVPPPVQVGNSSSNRAYSGLGNANVVPPPVQLNGAATGRTSVSALGNPNVVAPPIEVIGVGHGRSAASLGEAKIVPPPVQVNGVGGRHGASALADTKAVPPPVEVGSGSSHRANSTIAGGLTVVPPPVAAGETSGLGSGKRGAGLGSALDSGSVTAPPSHAGGGGAGSGIVLSSRPGADIGKPGSAGAGALALSPSGGAKPGLGGPGGGTDIARGAGSGSALKSAGPGAANSGNSAGADTIAKNGISPYPGSGGAGTGSVNKPAMPGVSVHGGSNVITLPSFAGDGSVSSLGRSGKMKGADGPDITVVGTSRSGGAFNLYGELKGDKVYTIYIDTTLGTAEMQYSDPSSAVHPYADDLVAPKPVRVDLPSNVKLSRMVISCTLDRSGALRNPKVLQSVSSETSNQVLAALSSWKFRPVFRGDQPIEVTAILGFQVDTR